MGASVTLGVAGRYITYHERVIDSQSTAELTLSTTMYIFLADARYFNGIKIILGATNSIKVVDQIWTQINWDDVFSFSASGSVLSVTNVSSGAKRLRYYLIQ